MDHVAGSKEDDRHAHILLPDGPRQGKTAGLNRAVPRATGEIIAFSDANSQYAPDVISRLVHCFTDPGVGYATGKMVYVNQDGSLIGNGCSAYMHYENAMRRLETRISSVVGVDGGVDAIRKSLYQSMNPDQLPDFVQPLKVVAQGKRVVYCEDALLHEAALDDSGSEFRMRVRVSLRAYWAMWDMKALFNPFRYGFFSLQLLSHKLLRYLAFVPLCMLLLASALLASAHWLYAVALMAQLTFYGVACYAVLVGENRNRWFGLANYFCLINTASLLAFIKFLRCKKIVTWKPRIG
jgi:cellulose synthase/poly-beta-1,6-N-acetylglucosamine synthase-like glycosyltransferase